MKKVAVIFALLAAAAVNQPVSASDIESKVENGYADSNGVKIHYSSIGPKSAPLIVMIHGFPDFWYTWRDQMEALSANYQCVALDLRGYNLSDKPKGVENYDMTLLIGDVAAVIKQLGRSKAIIVGHDWGGAIAWTFAMFKPEMTEKLIILNLPHPRGLRRELAHNPEQQKNSSYARNFQKEDAHKSLTAEALAGFVARDAATRAKYVEAFKRSDFEAMLNYYKRNYPREPYTEDTSPVVKVKCPVLMIHGLKDTALLYPALNGTWEWVDDLTLVTVPEAGHWVQRDASDLVSRTMKMWLAR
ncbi:MAG TPA: alpha/beta hydrolase [Blastocatellia bacterium]|nr:alpha/beta hydrolase [Blastocatellia bacterium]